MTGWGWLRVGAVLGFLGVGIGAFGAHGLKERLNRLETAAVFQTGVQYQMYHALALLAVGLMGGPLPTSRAGNVAGWAFLVGVVLFSGSLYVLALSGVRWLGAITPFGGVAMLVGWVALAVAATPYDDATPDVHSPGSAAVEAGAPERSRDVSQVPTP